MGGILPYGAVFIEMFFILQSLWMGNYYYVFGFLLLVFIILMVTCADIAMVFCYFQLCAEDYKWYDVFVLLPAEFFCGPYVLYCRVGVDTAQVQCTFAQMLRIFFIFRRFNPQQRALPSLSATQVFGLVLLVVPE